MTKEKLEELITVNNNINNIDEAIEKIERQPRRAVCGIVEIDINGNFIPTPVVDEVMNDLFLDNLKKRREELMNIIKEA